MHKNNDEFSKCSFSCFPFKIIIQLSDNSSYEGSGMSVGQKLPESVLEMTRNNKVFFAACIYTVYENTKKIINYTIPISIQTYTLLAPKPKILSRALLFIAPFTGEVSIFQFFQFNDKCSLHIRFSRFFYQEFLFIKN